MADGRHFEKTKNRHIYATVQAIDTKFGVWADATFHRTYF